MFKVNKKEYINKTLRLPEKLAEELQTVAQNKDISLNNLIEQCCQYALSHLDDENKLKTSEPDGE